jgi:anaerobic selenocysteine-containing dehydrogenase
MPPVVLAPPGGTITDGVVKTFCRNCSALCAMEVEVADGRVTGAKPDGSMSPYGAYLCPKGLASVEFHNGAEDRLFGSTKRGEDGELAPIDPAAAIMEIGDKLAALVAEHGPRCVAVYHGTGAYRSVLGGLLERAWVSALGTPNFFSTMTIDQSAKWVTMARMGVMASGRHAIRDADLILLAGGNPVVTHQGAPFALAESGAPGRSFQALKDRGGKVIIVDPRRTETARYADLLIQPLPGQDAVLFAAIAHILLRNGTFDADFLARHCRQLDELRAAVAPFTPEVASTRADVPIEQIELAAKWLGEARRPLVGSGTGPSMADHSNLADHMIEACGVLAGHHRRAGDLVRNPGTLKPKVAREMAISPTRSFENEPKCLSQDIGPLFGELPSALIPAEITCDHPDRIRALIVFGGDPLMALGDPAVAEPAFAALDLLVSLDCRLNETGKRAHYVVASSQAFERHELSISAESLYPTAFAQFTRPIVEKPEGVVHDWEFFWGIAACMGIPLTLKHWNYGLTYADIPLGLDLGTETLPDPEALFEFLSAESRIPFAELKANPGGVRPDIVPHFVEPAPPSWSGRLELCPPDVAGELAALAAEIPERNPSWPYRLISRRVLHALNGAYRDSREARRRYPVNFAYLNPGDMLDMGIADGDTVEIASDMGTVRTMAKAEDRLRRGVVSMTHMFGSLVGSGDPVRDGGANVGQLTSLTASLQPINFMPRFSAVPVSVRLVPATG